MQQLKNKTLKTSKAPTVYRQTAPGATKKPAIHRHMALRQTVQEYKTQAAPRQTAPRVHRSPSTWPELVTLSIRLCYLSPR